MMNHYSPITDYKLSINKFLSFIVFVLLVGLLNGCYVFRNDAYSNGRTGAFRYKKIESVTILTDTISSLSPGQFIALDLSVKRNLKRRPFLASETGVFYKHMTTPALYDYFTYEVINGNFSNKHKGIVVDKNLIFTGTPDTLEVIVKHKANGELVAKKKLIIDHKGDCTFNFGGRNGAPGQNGDDAFTSTPESEEPSGRDATDGGDGGDGEDGEHIKVEVRDTIINGIQLLDIIATSESRTQHNRVYADTTMGKVIISVSGGDGGDGGKGGDGITTDNWAGSGGSGGDGGDGGQAGSIECYITRSALSYLDKFEFQLDAGNPGKSGTAGYSEKEQREIDERRRINSQTLLCKVINFFKEGERPLDRNGFDGKAFFSEGNLTIIVVD